MPVYDGNWPHLKANYILAAYANFSILTGGILLLFSFLF